jgi:sugar phosphate isomerase/epimerase
LAAALVTTYVRGIDSLDPARHRAAADDLTAAVDAAAALGAPGVRVLAGRTAEPQLEARTDRFLDGLRRVAAYAQPAGVRLAIETKGWSMAHDVRSSLQLVQASGAAHAGLLYDPANLVMDGHDPLDGLDDPGLSLFHVHVKDLQRTPDGGCEPTALGRGVVPWRRIVARLHDLVFEGFLSLEYERRWHPRRLPPAEVGLAEELTVLRDLLARP